MNILLIDNYDSFTYNLVQYLGEQGADVDVKRNDEVSVKEVFAGQPDGIMISPGPGRPSGAGICEDLIRSLPEDGPPTLGVCLGHQAIGTALGGTVRQARQLMHGKTSPVSHQQKGVLNEVANPFHAARYHSLVLEESSLPDCLEITARTEDGEVMALCHREKMLEGIQFHPESILTREGKTIVRNFLDTVRSRF